MADLQPYYEDDLLKHLRENSFQQGQDDVLMEDNDDGQAQEPPKSKEIQEVLKVIRNQLEDSVSYCPVLSSTSSMFLTLVSQLIGDLSPSFYLCLLFQEVSY